MLRNVTLHPVHVHSELDRAHVSSSKDGQKLVGSFVRSFVQSHPATGECEAPINKSEKESNDDDHRRPATNREKSS